MDFCTLPHFLQKEGFFHGIACKEHQYAQTRNFYFLANSWQVILAGLDTQTQNAAFFERKRPKRKPWHRGKSLNRKKR